MSRPIYIFSISPNYTRCEVWHGSRTFKNRLGTSILVPDRGLTRERRYEVIAQWLCEGFDLLPPSYQTKAQRRRRQFEAGHGTGEK